MVASNLILQARTASGRSQAELAQLAGTSQPTLSAYERGTKSPMLAVAERIVAATGYSLALAPELTFNEVPGKHGLRPFWLANRLWPLAPGLAFRTVVVTVRLNTAGRRRFDLRVRDHCVRLYALMLREGQPRDLLEHLDGNLLVDIWGELDLPSPIRRAWLPLIRQVLDHR